MKGRASTSLFFRSFLIVACFFVIGCPLPPPPDPLFSFVIIADPHVYGGPGSENAVLLSHHPMHVSPGAFTTAEDQVVEAFTATFGDYVYANLAGHYHIDFQETRPLGQYELYVTEATHLGPNNLRLVRVYSDGTAFTYHHEHVQVPGNR